MNQHKPFINRVIQAILRRIRHRRILFSARKNSQEAVSTRQRLDKVLVVCYGNIYRSPLVEYLLKHNSNGGGLEVKSAGFFEKEGRGCAEEYLELLSKRGYDLAAHRSKKITDDDISWADIIIIMDRKNWDLMNEMSSSALEKTLWIGAFSPHMSVEVVDPYGLGEEATVTVIEQLERCVVDIIRRITDKQSETDRPLSMQKVDGDA